jgi:hypothetical protein
VGLVPLFAVFADSGPGYGGHFGKRRPLSSPWLDGSNGEPCGGTDPKSSGPLSSHKPGAVALGKLYRSHRCGGRSDKLMESTKTYFMERFPADISAARSDTARSAGLIDLRKIDA